MLGSRLKALIEVVIARIGVSISLAKIPMHMLRMYQYVKSLLAAKLPTG